MLSLCCSLSLTRLAASFGVVHTTTKFQDPDVKWKILQIPLDWSYHQPDHVTIRYFLEQKLILDYI